ncbi:hypothetical protein VUR80DRAFT_1335 [Thermomyces stellatus]
MNAKEGRGARGVTMGTRLVAFPSRTKAPVFTSGYLRARCEDASEEAPLIRASSKYPSRPGATGDTSFRLRRAPGSANLRGAHTPRQQARVIADPEWRSIGMTTLEEGARGGAGLPVFGGRNIRRWIRMQWGSLLAERGGGLKCDRRGGRGARGESERVQEKKRSSSESGRVRPAVDGEVGLSQIRAK